MHLPLLTRQESLQTCGVFGSCMRSSLSTCSKAASGADSLMLHSGTSDSKPMLVSTCMPLTNNNNNNNDDSDINNKSCNNNNNNNNDDDNMNSLCSS